MKGIELKVLCLGFWSPPLIRPRAILLGKIIPEWIKQGIKPVIVTYENGGDWRVGAPVYRIASFDSLCQAKQSALARAIKKYFYYRQLVKKTAALIKKHGINLIFSFANPQDSNILGAMLKKKTGVKFISHFSDPWYDNPYKKFKKINGWKVLRLERMIVKNSERVIFTNRQAKELIMKKYPANWSKKALVVSHCFDSADYPAASGQSRQDGAYIFSHIGAFYKERNPEFLFKAFSNLKKSGRIGKFKFKLIGGANKYATYNEDELRKKINEYGLTGEVEAMPPVDYRESLRYMVEADCLVVIDADFSRSPFLPSKLIDYAGSGKMILGITPRGSTTAEFLKDIGYESFAYDEEKRLENYLKRLINGEIKNNGNALILKKYSVQSITAKIKKIFNEALN